jgi:hypothetical protein
MVRVCRELATLLDNLLALYREWIKANDEVEEEDSKKPAACRLLLDDEKVSGTEVSESTTTKPATGQAEGISAHAVDDVVSAASKEADAIKTSNPSPQLVEAQEKDIHRDESNDVEMSDASLSSRSENANAEGIL